MTYNGCCNFGWEYIRSIGGSSLYNVRRYDGGAGSVTWSLDSCGGAVRIIEVVSREVSGTKTFMPIIQTRSVGNNTSAIVLEYYTEIAGSYAYQWGKTVADLQADVGNTAYLPQPRATIDTSGNAYVSYGIGIVKYNSSGVKQWYKAIPTYNDSTPPTNFLSFNTGLITCLDTDGTYIFTGHSRGDVTGFGGRNAGRWKCSDGSSQIPTNAITPGYSENVDWIRIGQSRATDLFNVSVAGSNVFYTGNDLSTGQKLFATGKGSTYWFPPTPFVWGVNTLYNPRTIDSIGGDILLIGENNKQWQTRDDANGSLVYSGQNPSRLNAVLLSGVHDDSGYSPAQNYIAESYGINGYVTCFQTDGSNTVLWSKLWPEISTANARAFALARSGTGVIAGGDRVSTASI